MEENDNNHPLIYQPKMEDRVVISAVMPVETAIQVNCASQAFGQSDMLLLKEKDFNAGYLITAWEYDSFYKGGKTIRSRIIITNSGITTENNYSVIVVSQIGNGDVASFEDNKYTDWNRLLKKYQVLLEDMEIRLQ